MRVILKVSSVSMKEDSRKQLVITRYPSTTDRSLQAFSAADEFVLKELADEDLLGKTIAIYGDRFGFLSAHLHHLNPFTVVVYKSQQKALQENFTRNNLTLVDASSCSREDQDRWISPLTSPPENIDLGIIRVPKSLDLFRLYLERLVPSLSDDGRVICSFMTRYFSPQILSIAEEFFEVAEQSLAWKKSRLLTLSKKKVREPGEVLNTIPYAFEDGSTQEFKQYFGVFSARTIDYATQFLLEHLELNVGDEKILDLASGNGIIARAIQRKSPDAELHLVDDSVLAVESSRLNLNEENTHFHWDDTLDQFAKNSFDLVVSNPPFHFGHETNIEVSLRLFREVHEVLKPGGRFVCVANRHLNYKPHLKKSFQSVRMISENDKFVIYCSTRRTQSFRSSLS